MRRINYFGIIISLLLLISSYFISSFVSSLHSSYYDFAFPLLLIFIALFILTGSLKGQSLSYLLMKKDISPIMGKKGDKIPTGKGVNLLLLFCILLFIFTILILFSLKTGIDGKVTFNWLMNKN